MGNDEEFCGPKHGQAMGVVGSSRDQQWGDEQGRNLMLCNDHSTQKLYRKGMQPGVLGKDARAGHSTLRHRAADSSGGGRAVSL